MIRVFAQTVDVGNLDDLVDVDNVTTWDIVAAGVVLVVGFIAARLTRRAVRRAFDKFDHTPEAVAALGIQAAGWTVMLVAIVYALSLVGFDLGPVVLVLIIVGVVVFLSGRSLAENFGAGLVLQTRSPFEAGDQIETNGYRGWVEEVTGRTVILRTIDGELIHLPNSSVLANPIINLTALGRRRTTLTVGVEYGTDLADAAKVMRRVVTESDRVLPEPEPQVVVGEFADSSINFNIRFWHRPLILDQRLALDQVARAIDVALKEASIVIAFPQRKLWMGSGGAAEGPGLPGSDRDG